MKKEDAGHLLADHRGRPPEDLLRHFLSTYSRSPGEEKDRIALASSLSAEDQVLTHVILMIRPEARIFVLDTGRLHSETYDLMDRTMKEYGMHYEILFPERSDVEEMESSCGSNLMYESIENRKRCCHVRKVKPLRRILSTLDVWITGLRKEQAITRAAVEKIEWDEAKQAKEQAQDDPK